MTPAIPHAKVLNCFKFQKFMFWVKIFEEVVLGQCLKFDLLRAF